MSDKAFVKRLVATPGLIEDFLGSLAEKYRAASKKEDDDKEKKLYTDIAVILEDAADDVGALFEAAEDAQDDEDFEDDEEDFDEDEDDEEFDEDEDDEL